MIKPPNGLRKAGTRTAPRGRATVVTLSEIAGVAASTVSRALQNDPRISPGTRKRILALAEAEGYTPNLLARTLASGKSGLVGLVIGSVQNPFYAVLLEEIVAQAAARGLRMLVVHAGNGAIDAEMAAALLKYQVDGCLIASAELSSRAADICAAHRVPMVMVNRVARRHAGAVACDNLGGGQEIARFLLAGGHRRFAVVQGHLHSSTATDRARGFAEALAEAGLPPPMTLAGGSTYDGGLAVGQALAALPPAERPDAVFAVSDEMACAVIDALRGAGVGVPREVSVVGFDGTPLGARPAYDLTTIVPPVAGMVARALEMLEARIEDAEVPPEVVVLPGELVLRGSARRP
jgi:DNA-binding LacI/PurR family transcriptional regulator